MVNIEKREIIMWKDIIELDGKYQVSDSGQVRNAKTGRILKSSLNWRGKLSVYCGDVQLEVSKLVGKYFLIQPNSHFTELLAVDGDETNCAAINLKYICPYTYFEEEQWATVSGFEGLYEVSDFGRVRSCERDCMDATSGKKNRKVFNKLIEGHDDGHGYLQVQLNKDGKTYVKYIHRLVAEAFIPNPENKPEVNHKDGKKFHNEASNLEWCTRPENIQHSILIGLRELNAFQQAGKQATSRKCMCIETGKVYSSRKEASRDMGIWDTNICWSIRTGKPTKGYTFADVL